VRRMLATGREHSTTSRHSSLPGAYWKQWSASLISNLGDGINFVAMPLLALSMTSDERLLALVSMATLIPWLIVALPVGVLIDRTDRRRLMIVANLCRVALFAIVAASASGDWLGIAGLFAILLVVGTCEVVFDSTAQAFLPMIVPSAQLERANGLLFAAEVVAGSILGLSIGALLFDVGSGIPFAVNAASFAVAALVLLTIKVSRVDATTNNSAEGSPVGLDLRSGISWLLEQRVLATLAVMFAVTNLGLMFGQGIFAKYAVDVLGLDSLGFGLLLTITAMGAATGGLLGSKVITRIGIRNAVVAPYLVFGVAQFVIGAAPPAWVVGAAGFLMGAGITVWNVATITVRQRLIPSERFGRVNGVYRWLGAAASAVGIGLGGLVAYATNLQVPFVVGGAITLIAAALFARPVLRGLAEA
jgi:MFS family permease